MQESEKRKEEEEEEGAKKWGDNLNARMPPSLPFPSLLPTIGIPFCQSGILLPEVYGICCDGGGSELPACVNMAEWMGKRRGELFVSPIFAGGGGELFTSVPPLPAGIERRS